jgi:hypothetical protein
MLHRVLDYHLSTLYFRELHMCLYQQLYNTRSVKCSRKTISVENDTTFILYCTNTCWHIFLIPHHVLYNYILAHKTDVSSWTVQLDIGIYFWCFIVYLITICLHCILENCTCVFINSYIILGLSNAPGKLFQLRTTPRQHIFFSLEFLIFMNQHSSSTYIILNMLL